MTRTKTQKARARAQAPPRQPAAVARTRAPARKQQPNRWHVAASTPWGNLSAGSGDKASTMRTGRAVMGRNTETVMSAPRVEQQEELIGAVTGSIAFKQTTFDFQPASKTTFPWLYEIARKYQKWYAVSVEFEFRSSAEVFSTAGKQGRIVMAFDYDAIDADFTTLQQAETISPHSVGTPSKCCVLRLDPEMLNGSSRTGKYVRPGIVPIGGDKKSYDGGSFHFCTSGMETDNAQIGEIYVIYRIALLSPIIPGMESISKSVAQSATCFVALDGAALTISGSAVNLPLTIRTGVDAWNAIDVVDIGTGIQVHAGKYKLSCSWQAFCAAGTMSYFVVYWSKNGSSITNSQTGTKTGASNFLLSVNSFAYVDAAEGDVFTLTYYCTSAAVTTSGFDPNVLIELV